MSGTAEDPPIKIQTVMEVRDNWYVTYQTSNRRVLAVGLYLPAPADGITTELVPWGHPIIPELLQLLNTRWHGDQLIGTIVSTDDDAA